MSRGSNDISRAVWLQWSEWSGISTELKENLCSDRLIDSMIASQLQRVLKLLLECKAKQRKTKNNRKTVKRNDRSDRKPNRFEWEAHPKRPKAVSLASSLVSTVDAKPTLQCIKHWKQLAFLTTHPLIQYFSLSFWIVFKSFFNWIFKRFYAFCMTLALIQIKWEICYVSPLKTITSLLGFIASNVKYCRIKCNLNLIFVILETNVGQKHLLFDYFRNHLKYSTLKSNKNLFKRFCFLV